MLLTVDLERLRRPAPATDSSTRAAARADTASARSIRGASVVGLDLDLDVDVASTSNDPAAIAGEEPRSDSAAMLQGRRLRVCPSAMRVLRPRSSAAEVMEHVHDYRAAMPRALRASLRPGGRRSRSPSRLIPANRSTCVWGTSISRVRVVISGSSRPRELARGDGGARACARDGLRLRPRLPHARTGSCARVMHLPDADRERVSCAPITTGPRSVRRARRFMDPRSSRRCSTSSVRRASMRLRARSPAAAGDAHTAPRVPRGRALGRGLIGAARGLPRDRAAPHRCFVAYRGNMNSGGQGIYLWFLVPRDGAAGSSRSTSSSARPIPDEMPFAADRDGASAQRAFLGEMVPRCKD